jgi:hypothetical protein
MLEKFKCTNPFSLLRQRVGIIPARENLKKIYLSNCGNPSGIVFTISSIAFDMFWR